MTGRRDDSDQQLPLPLEEPAADACLGITHYLIGAPGGGNARSNWDSKVSMMLADYSRRSEDVIPPALQDRLHRAVIRSFGAARQEVDMDELTRHLPTRQRVDVAIVTILPEELRATLYVFDVVETPHRSQPFYRTSVPCRGRPDRDLSIVVTAASKPLNVHIARPVERLRDLFPPSVVFLVGIAGGRKGRVKHGDVVVSQRVHYYPPGRLTQAGIAPRPEVAEPHDEYGNGLYSYDPRRTGFFERVTNFVATLPPEQRPSALPEDFRPKVHHPATIAAGEIVMRDGALLAQLARRDDAIRAVDQESYGFASSVRDLPWAVFRGVSDLADQRQDDRWKYASAGIAALCLRDFLENYFVPSDVAEL